jgi:hypothetical protein
VQSSCEYGNERSASINSWKLCSGYTTGQLVASHVVLSPTELVSYIDSPTAINVPFLFLSFTHRTYSSKLS